MASVNYYMHIGIGDAKYAIDPLYVSHIYRYPSKIVPYPGDKDVFIEMADMEHGSIPVVNAKLLGLSVDIEKKYLLVLEVKEKKFGIGCGEVFGIYKKIQENTEIISPEEILDRS
ncbi:hypothetical protein KAI78_09235 [bacterium]|nr:hypothetical protein [bacterium]